MTRLTIYVLVWMWFNIWMWCNTLGNTITIHTWESSDNLVKAWIRIIRPCFLATLPFLARDKYQDENKVRVSVKNRTSLFPTGSKKINSCKKKINKQWLKQRLWQCLASVNQEYKWLLWIVLKEFMKLAMIKYLVFNVQTWFPDVGAPILTYLHKLPGWNISVTRRPSEITKGRDCWYLRTQTMAGEDLWPMLA